MMQQHKSFDGKVDPSGRKGMEISRGARRLNLCDSCEAITSGRSYKKKSTSSEACRIIDEESGKQFDPEMAQTFIRMVEKNDLQH